MADSDKIAVEHLFKIFGDDPATALARIEEGAGRDEILAETGQVVGVHDANFTISAGEIFVIMGLSGSGKSTLLRMINRLIEPTAGRILIDGQDMTAMSEKELTALRRAEMGMVFQHFALFPHKDVLENVQFALKICGVAPDERARRAQTALEQVGLAANAGNLPSELSGGMQQRVGLARALAADSNILLMDEPFSALDPLIRRDMQKELLELESDSPRTIVFVTHDLHEALVLGDRIAIMRGGKIIQIGTGEEIVANPADDYVAAFTRDIDRSRVFTAGTIMQEPKAVPLDSVDLRDMRQVMRTTHRRGLYVVDSDNRPVGLIPLRQIDRKGLDAHRDDVMRRDFPVCSAGDAFFDLYGMCAAGVPVAVTDDDGRLTGVFEPLDVFAQMAPDSDEQQSGPADRAVAGGAA